jgi:hypothetical protein
MNQIYIKQIIPNLYIGSNIDIYNEDISSNYNIKSVISINNNIEDDGINILNLYIKDNDLLIKSNKNNININIDFDLCNKFIENSYINKHNILINSNNIILSSIIAITFIIKKLDITLIDAIYYVYKIINIDLKNIPSSYIHTIFKYYSTSSP